MPDMCFLFGLWPKLTYPNQGRNPNFEKSVFRTTLEDHNAAYIYRWKK
jgi:hypothetical protein